MDVMRKILIILTTLCWTCFLQAQSFSTASWWAPSGDVFSPVVSSDGHITFRLKASKARTVELEFDEWTLLRCPMTQREDGVWEVTVGPVKPGNYEYKFFVDGLKVLDYGNPAVKTGTEIYCNTVDVPGGRFDERKLPGSQVDVITYRSSSLGTIRRVCVYVPTVYFDAPRRKFPVLYLRHGGGDTERSWWDSASADAILDNLIAGGKAEPMLVVMPYGLTDGSWAGGSTPEGMRLLEQELLEDIIPLVEKRYRVLPGRDNRAIAGLSMGGGQAFVMGLRNLDKFAWVGEFSSGLLADSSTDYGAYGILLDAAAVNRSLRLLWLSCGTLDTRWQGHLELLKRLDDAGIRYQSHQAEYGHQWQFWREQLRDFASVLFKK